MPPVIVIHEPELGFHPSAIPTIAQWIQAASSKRQVIVTTTSPKLVSAFDPEDVVVMESEEDCNGLGCSTLPQLSRERLGAWLDDYDLGLLFDRHVTSGGPQ